MTKKVMAMSTCGDCSFGADVSQRFYGAKELPVPHAAPRAKTNRFALRSLSTVLFAFSHKSANHAEVLDQSPGLAQQARSSFLHSSLAPKTVGHKHMPRWVINPQPERKHQQGRETAGPAP